MASFVLQTEGLNNQANAIITDLVSGFIDIYTTAYASLLVHIPMANPIGTQSGGVITLTTTGMNANAGNTGTAAVAKITKSNGTEFARVDVSTSGATINLQNTSINSGQNVSITSATITVPAGT